MANPVSVALRPLTGGMNTKKAASQLAVGEFVNAENCVFSESGPRPVPSIENFIDDVIPLATGDIVTDIFDVSAFATSSTLVAMSYSGLYAYSGDGWLTIPWKITGTSGDAHSTTEWTISGGDFTGQDLTTDMYVVDQLGNERAITTIEAQKITHAAFSVAPTSLYVRYRLISLEPYITQGAMGPDRLYFVDGGSNGIMATDGATMWKEALTADFSGARCIAYIQGRLVVGNTTESDAGASIRLRWSGVVDVLNFGPYSYVDFTESRGEIIAIKSIEGSPVVFTRDQIYSNSEAQMPFDTFNSPWIFQRLETAGVSAAGPRAIVSALNTILFMGIDDFYVIEPTKRTDKGEFVVQKANCPIRSVFADGGSMSMACGIYERRDESFYFSVPLVGGAFFRMVVFNYVTKAWSVVALPANCTAMADSFFNVSETWGDYEDLTGGDIKTWDTFLASPKSWAAFSAGAGNGQTLFARSGGTVGRLDADISSQKCVLETGDLDFDEADTEKSIYKVALRFSKRDTGTITYSIGISSNRGATYKWVADTLTVDDQTNEGEIHCRYSGTNARFRVEFTSTKRETLEEITASVKLAGTQVIRSSI